MDSSINNNRGVKRSFDEMHASTSSEVTSQGNTIHGSDGLEKDLNVSTASLDTSNDEGKTESPQKQGDASEPGTSKSEQQLAAQSRKERLELERLKMQYVVLL